MWKLCLLVLFAASCASDWTPKVYEPDPLTGAVERAQTKERVECTDTAFREFSCMTKADLEHLHQECLKPWWQKW